MTDEQIAKQIRANLRTAFPNTVFQVLYRNSELDLERIGGSDCKDQFSTQKQAVEAVEHIIQKTIPNFKITSYE